MNPDHVPMRQPLSGVPSAFWTLIAFPMYSRLIIRGGLVGCFDVQEGSANYRELLRVQFAKTVLAARSESLRCAAVIKASDFVPSVEFFGLGFGRLVRCCVRFHASTMPFANLIASGFCKIIAATKKSESILGKS